MSKNLPTAHFANEFALQGRLSFETAREWLIFIYLVAQLDSFNQHEMPAKAVLPISELKKVLDNRSGSFYEQIREGMEKMASSLCRFDSDISVNGQKLPRIITVFKEAGAIQTPSGPAIVFEFNDKMQPLLLNLKHNFVGLQTPSKMSSGHAINFLIYAKAERDRRKKHDGKRTFIRFSIEELKKKLNIVGKYKQIKDFKKRIISTIHTEVNKSNIIKISSITYERTGRRISHVIFTIEDVKQIKNNLLTSPTDSLTFAQEKAFTFLTEKGVFEKSALRIISEIPSSICEGYEDYFCEEIFKIVREKSKIKDANEMAPILVDWFKKDVFKTDQFSRIIEQVHARKKALKPNKRDNREIAKNMTSAEFTNWYKTNNK